jgi:hypothetical protein
MPKRTRLPSHLPAGSKYVIESRGGMKGSIWMHRYLELPDGRRVDLPPRLIPIGGTTSSNPTESVVHVAALLVGEVGSASCDERTLFPFVHWDRPVKRKHAVRRRSGRSAFPCLVRKPASVAVLRA